MIFAFLFPDNRRVILVLAKIGFHAALQQSSCCGAAIPKMQCSSHCFFTKIKRFRRFPLPASTAHRRWWRRGAARSRLRWRRQSAPSSAESLPGCKRCPECHPGAVTTERVAQATPCRSSPPSVYDAESRRERHPVAEPAQGRVHRQGVAWATRWVVTALKGGIPDNVYNREVIPRSKSFGGASATGS